MKALVGAFNQEKALVGAFSVIVKTGCGTDGSFNSNSGDPGTQLHWRQENVPFKSGSAVPTPLDTGQWPAPVSAARRWSDSNKRLGDNYPVPRTRDILPGDGETNLGFYVIRHQHHNSSIEQTFKQRCGGLKCFGRKCSVIDCWYYTIQIFTCVQRQAVAKTEK